MASWLSPRHARRKLSSEPPSTKERHHPYMWYLSQSTAHSLVQVGGQVVGVAGRAAGRVIQKVSVPKCTRRSGGKSSHFRKLSEMQLGEDSRLTLPFAPAQSKLNRNDSSIHYQRQCLLESQRQAGLHSSSKRDTWTTSTVLSGERSHAPTSIHLHISTSSLSQAPPDNKWEDPKTTLRNKGGIGGLWGICIETSSLAHPLV
jgi:hypothetical protein